jgi:hypothetical protein
VECGKEKTEMVVVEMIEGNEPIDLYELALEEKEAAYQQIETAYKQRTGVMGDAIADCGRTRLLNVLWELEQLYKLAQELTRNGAVMDMHWSHKDKWWDVRRA